MNVKAIELESFTSRAGWLLVIVIVVLESGLFPKRVLILKEVPSLMEDGSSLRIKSEFAGFIPINKPSSVFMEVLVNFFQVKK